MTFLSHVTGYVADLPICRGQFSREAAIVNNLSGMAIGQWLSFVSGHSIHFVSGLGSLIGD
jgi:hypothetical protein